MNCSFTGRCAVMSAAFLLGRTWAAGMGASPSWGRIPASPAAIGPGRPPSGGRHCQSMVAHNSNFNETITNPSSQDAR